MRLHRAFADLIMRMHSGPQQVGCQTLGELVREKEVESGVQRALKALGRTTAETPARSKQADATWASMSRNRSSQSQCRRPSVALEVGYSEPRAKLRRDA